MPKSVNVTDTVIHAGAADGGGPDHDTEWASIADLERLEGDIEEAIIDLMGRPHDDEMIADLKRRKLHLEAEIEWLRHHVGAGAKAH